MQTISLCKRLIWGAAAIVLSSCGKTNNQGKLIPKEAAVVIQIDGRSLSDKLPWDEIKQNPLFGEMKDDSSLPATFKSLIDNPENAGIDTKSELMFFAIKDSMGGYIGFEGKIKDENTFKTFNLKITENVAQREKDGVQFIIKSPVCVGWTKEKFVYIFDTPQLSQMDELSKRMISDSIDITRRKIRDIGATCKSVFTLKESNSLATDKKFNQLMEQKGDVHFWMNTEELSKGSSTITALSMVNLDKFYRGNITAATMNFENGKMVLNTKTYASEEMISLFKKYSGGKVNEDMMRRMPGKDVVAVMALNFKPEAIQELIKMTGLDGLLNLGIEKFGFSMNDFIKANKGDILLGISDLVMNTDTATNQLKEPEGKKSISQKPTFNFIFSASIGDKGAFNKLINAGKKLGGESYSDSSMFPVSYNSNGTYFVMSNKKQNADQYLSTPTSNFDFIPKICGEPFGGFLNIQTLLRSFQGEVIKDSSAKIVYDASLKMWDNILWKGGGYSDGGILQSVEINLVDKSTNSLKQLNQYLSKFNEIYKEKRIKQQEKIMAFQDFETADGTVAPPAAKSK